MANSYRRHTLGTIAAVSASVLLFWSCGGGGDGGSPTAPTTGVGVEGHWSGNTEFESASGCGCVGQEIATLQSDWSNYTEWNILEDGTALQGNFYDDWGIGWCEFTGTSVSGSFGATSTQCESEELEWECEDGSERTLVLASSSWQGTLSNVVGNIDGGWSRVFDCYNSKNGADAGNLTQEFSFRLWKCSSWESCNS